MLVGCWGVSFGDGVSSRAPGGAFMAGSRGGLGLAPGLEHYFLTTNN